MNTNTPIKIPATPYTLTVLATEPAGFLLPAKTGAYKWYRVGESSETRSFQHHDLGTPKKKIAWD